MNAPDLSICIINHKTPELTRQCLHSIADTVGDLAIEVMVVNNTADACNVAGIRRPDGAVLEISFIQNASPLGFSANQNHMLRRATGRYLMPLNSDTIVTPGALRNMVHFMDAQPRCGIAGPRLVNADGSLQPSCHNFPSLVSTFMEVSGRWQLFRGSRLVGRFFEVCSPHDRVRAVDWLIAACIIVRREAADVVGLFDAETYPYMFAEDLDWCWRMNQAGWQVMFTPRATVTHLENRTFVPMREVESHRSTVVFLRKHYRPHQAWLVFRAAQLAIFLKWLMIRNPERRQSLRRILALY